MIAGMASTQQKVATASGAGGLGVGVLMWGVDYFQITVPPGVAFIAVGGAAFLVVFSVALWVHTAWKWLRTRGLQLGPAILMGLGLTLFIPGAVWAIWSWKPPQQQNSQVPPVDASSAAVVAGAGSAEKIAETPTLKSSKKQPAPAPAQASSAPTENGYAPKSQLDATVELWKRAEQRIDATKLAPSIKAALASINATGDALAVDRKTYTDPFAWGLGYGDWLNSVKKLRYQLMIIKLDDKLSLNLIEDPIAGAMVSSLIAEKIPPNAPPDFSMFLYQRERVKRLTPEINRALDELVIQPDGGRPDAR